VTRIIRASLLLFEYFEYMQGPRHPAATYAVRRCVHKHCTRCRAAPNLESAAATNKINLHPERHLYGKYDHTR
jgi:hypothetical protein